MKTTSTEIRRSWPAVALIYAAGFLQGLTLVCVPALSGELKQALNLSDAQYGTLFLPQVACTVLGALCGGGLAQRLSLKNLLTLALLANALSQIAIVISGHVGGDMAFTLLLASAACLGTGFGLSSAPLNAYPPVFFPAHRDAAVVALHTGLGLGLAAGPLIASPFVMAGMWTHFPALLCALAAVLTIASLLVRLPVVATAAAMHTAATHEPPPHRSPTFWLFVLIAVLYAFAEGTFSNWAVIYLHEDRRLSADIAGAALSVFWGALAIGRLVISALVVRVPAERLWIALPVLMIAAFLLLPHAQSATVGIALFALAGLACSGFFPLTIARVSQQFPAHTAWVSSMMVAALMIGVGIGTYLVAPLRAMLALEDLYVVSAGYPIAVLILALFALRREAAKRPTAAAAAMSASL